MTENCYKCKHMDVGASFLISAFFLQAIQMREVQKEFIFSVLSINVYRAEWSNAEIFRIKGAVTLKCTLIQILNKTRSSLLVQTFYKILSWMVEEDLDLPNFFFITWTLAFCVGPLASEHGLPSLLKNFNWHSRHNGREEWNLNTSLRWKTKIKEFSVAI